MKKFTAVLVMFCVVLTAGLAVAGDASVDGDGNAVGMDVGIENTVDANATGGNAQQDQNQDQNQDQMQGQIQTAIGNGGAGGNATATGGAGGNATGGDASLKDSANSSVKNSYVNKTPRNFLGTPTAPNMMNAPAILGIEGCVPIFGAGMNAEFSINRIENMKASSFLEKKGGWWHGLWSSRIKSSVEVPFEGDERHNGSIRLINWDLASWSGPEDRSLGTFNCEGDYGYPLNATLGMCLSEAYAETNTDRVYACYTVRRDAHSSGTAYSGAGGASTIPGSGNTAYAGSVAATFGTSASYANIAYDVTLVALNRGETQRVVVYAQPEPEKVIEVPVITEPKPVQKPDVCDTDEIWRKISELKQEVQKCTRYCYNNLTLRSALGEAYIELYVCTGNKKFLKEAIYHFEVAERNYRLGHDIAFNRGVASHVIAQTYYNWAGCVWETQGKKVALKFKAAKKLERIPKGFVRK